MLKNNMFLRYAIFIVSKTKRTFVLYLLISGKSPYLKTQKKIGC